MAMLWHLGMASGVDDFPHCPVLFLTVKLCSIHVPNLKTQGRKLMIIFRPHSYNAMQLQI